MKKFTAILLLVILLFYTAGYYWIFTILENKATANLEQHIDSGKYSDEELVEIRIPLSMPYYSDKEFESVYGETDWYGQHYQYVKRKVKGNVLILLCLPNAEKNSITAAKNNLTKNLADISSSNSSNQKQAPATAKLKLSDFDANETYLNPFRFTALKEKYSIANERVNSLFIPITAAQPPEAL